MTLRKKKKNPLPATDNVIKEMVSNRKKKERQWETPGKTKSYREKTGSPKLVNKLKIWHDFE